MFAGVKWVKFHPQLSYTLRQLVDIKTYVFSWTDFFHLTRLWSYLQLALQSPYTESRNEFVEHVTLFTNFLIIFYLQSKEGIFVNNQLIQLL